jgi:hypothetical protein
MPDSYETVLVAGQVWRAAEEKELLPYWESNSVVTATVPVGFKWKEAAQGSGNLHNSSVR